MTEHIGLADAKAKFSEVVEGVLHKGKRYVIERHGKPVAALVGLDDLAAIEAETPTGHRPAGALALVGAWADINDSEIDAFLADIRAARDADLGRPVSLEP